MTLRRMIFTVGPWRERFGDPCRPELLMGVPVVRELAVDPEAGVALVALGDRRFALTGRTLAIGPADKLAAYLRRRASACASTAEASWLRAGAAMLVRVRHDDQLLAGVET